VDVSRKAKWLQVLAYPELRQIATSHEYKASYVHLKQTVCNLYDSDLFPLMTKLQRYCSCVWSCSRSF